jgi:hypothetical protein
MLDALKKVIRPRRESHSPQAGKSFAAGDYDTIPTILIDTPLVKRGVYAE